jgi:hypothetical protein
MLEVATISLDRAGDAPLTFEPGSELDSGDMMLLGSGANVQSSPPLKKIRPRHHALAKALARGMRPGIAAATHGFSVSRVSILASDPTFKDLIEFYRREESDAHLEQQGRLSGIAVAALDELAERLEDEPEKLTVAQLTKLASLGADRTGNGPKASSDVNVTFNIAEKMRKAQERLERHKTIEGEMLPQEAAE